MNNCAGTQPTTKSRSHVDIADNFYPAITTIQAINDLLTEATKDKEEKLSSLAEGTLFALADRCWQEAMAVEKWTMGLDYWPISLSGS